MAHLSLWWERVYIPDVTEKSQILRGGPGGLPARS